MQTELNILKEYILSTNKYFNNGYINVYFDASSMMYVNDTMPLGIEDSLGNYFYIRSLGNTRYNTSKTQLSSCNNSQEINQDFRLISVVENGINYKMIECLLNSILSFQKIEIKINSSNDITESVIRSEYFFFKKDKINSILMNLRNKKIVSIDFTIKKDFQPSLCECKPCNDC